MARALKNLNGNSFEKPDFFIIYERGFYLNYKIIIFKNYLKLRCIKLLSP